MDSQFINHPVGQAVNEHRSQIVSDVLTAAFTNPFWDDRYPTRGRAAASQDVHHTLDLLVAAIQLNDTATMLRYAAWLRTVLVHRGMCTEHVRECLLSPAQACDARLPQQHSAVTRTYFDTGLSGLVYTEPGALSLWSAADAIGETTLANLAAAHPEEARLGLSSADSLYGSVFSAADLRYLLSYLADALQEAKPALFADYVAWLRRYYGRHYGSTKSLERWWPHLWAAIVAHISPAALPAIAAPFNAAVIARSAL